MACARPLDAEYDEYLHDESRTVGSADMIAFPTSEREVIAALREANPDPSARGAVTPVTVQGGRTGLAAGAVPRGGLVLNLSRMNRVVGVRREAGRDGGPSAYYVRVQPGVVLAQLRKYLEDRNLPTAGMDEGSLRAWDALANDREYFFPTDPTETSATIGGIVACNASGARSYRYGPARPHVSAVRVVLADGDVIALARGEVRAHGRHLRLRTASGREIAAELPPYVMPHAKNASGYYAADDMDAVDVFVGSDGTLGVITEVELALCPLPAAIWGVSCFLPSESAAVDLTIAARRAIGSAAAIEYFDGDALDVLRAQRDAGEAFSSLLAPPDEAGCCVYVELQCADDGQAYRELCALGELVTACGGSEALTWVGRTASDREQQRFFRHAVPESVNMLIDRRRRDDPTITKLGSDMSVPDDRLRDVVALYRRTLAEEGLQTAVWGHIGNNHLHVNVLPHDADEFARGKRLFARWAREVSAMGGAVSAEHGVGKLKRDFLREMYGPQGVAAMARLKRAFDPAGVLGRGNLFPESLLDDANGRA